MNPETATTSSEKTKENLDFHGFILHRQLLLYKPPLMDGEQHQWVLVWMTIPHAPRISSNRNGTHNN